MPAPAELIATLARTATPAIAQGHHQWWRKWRERVAQTDAAFRDPTPEERARTDPAGATHLFNSYHDTRVAARLITHGPSPDAAVIVLHGYSAAEPLDDRTLTDRPSTAICKLRVRGFPGSQLDAGPLADHPAGWIAANLHDPDAAALTAAVADVVLAARALKRRFGDIPVMLRGDSLGGGLAVIAAAQALDDAPIHRLVITLPSLGDWTPRLLDDAPAGATADAARALQTAEDQAPLRRTLRLADAAIHARRVHAPALCLLAAQDPVVPPQTAAAIYNALGSDPGLKRRIIIDRGHQPLEQADLRRLAAFEALAARFLDPDTDPAAALSQRLDLD